MPSPRDSSSRVSRAPGARRIAWRGWKAARSVATLTSSSSPASTPAGTDSSAPSSASIVFSATSGSRVGTCERAEVAAIGEAREPDRRRQRRQLRPELAIDEHDPRRLDARQAAVVDRLRHRLLERGVGNRPQGGVFPRLLAPSRCGAGQAGATERIGGGIPRSADRQAGDRASPRSARGSRRCRCGSVRSRHHHQTVIPAKAEPSWPTARHTESAVRTECTEWNRRRSGAQAHRLELHTNP